MMLLLFMQIRTKFNMNPVICVFSLISTASPFHYRGLAEVQPCEIPYSHCEDEI